MNTTHTVELSSAVEQNDKGQDQPFSGVTASGKYYSGVFDGHGKNNVIDALREYQTSGKLNEFMDNETPIEAIQQRLKDDELKKQREEVLKKLREEEIRINNLNSNKDLKTNQTAGISSYNSENNKLENSFNIEEGIHNSEKPPHNNYKTNSKLNSKKVLLNSSF